MSTILDAIESFKNLFNWTRPYRTYPLYLGLLAIWAVTIVVPGRMIILGVGLYEFFFVLLTPPSTPVWGIRVRNALQVDRLYTISHYTHYTHYVSLYTHYTHYTHYTSLYTLYFTIHTILHYTHYISLYKH